MQNQTKNGIFPLSVTQAIQVALGTLRYLQNHGRSIDVCGHFMTGFKELTRRPHGNLNLLVSRNSRV